MAYSVDLTKPNYQDTLLTLGVTGECHYAPLAAEPPKGMEAYKEPHVTLGWISDEGLSEAIAEETSDFTPWQAQSPVKESVTQHEFTFTFTLWSIGGLANALRYRVPESDMKFNDEGEFVEFVQGGKLPENFRFRFAIDVIDGDKHRRFWLPRASIVDPGETTYQKDSLVGYPMTVKANLDHELGYSILRRFKEGWKPGEAGADGKLLKGARDLGDWSGFNGGDKDTGSTNEDGGASDTGRGTESDTHATE